MCWNVYVLEMVIPPHMIRHCQGEGWGGGLQHPGGGGNKILRPPMWHKLRPSSSCHIGGLSILFP